MEIGNLSLAEIVTAQPLAAQVFENFKLDFCCGGKRKLSEALIDDDDKLKEVTASLEKIFQKATTTETDFNKFSLTQLVDYIFEKHHRYVKTNIPVIKQHLEKVSLKHGETNPEMKKIKILFDEIERDFEQHMMKEEAILFPRIKKMEAAFNDGNSSGENFDVQQPINIMELEHVTAGSIMEEIKNLSGNYTPPCKCLYNFSRMPRRTQNI